MIDGHGNGGQEAIGLPARLTISLKRNLEMKGTITTVIGVSIGAVLYHIARYGIEEFNWQRAAIAAIVTLSVIFLFRLVKKKRNT